GAPRRPAPRRTDPLRPERRAAGSAAADPPHRLSVIRDDMLSAATKFRLFICCGAALVILGLAWAGSGWGGVPTGNRTPLILAFGDSLTSGFGLPAEDSFL